MILPIKHVAGLRYTRHRNKSKTEKNIICNKFTQINYDHTVGDLVFLRNKAEYKHETPFIGPWKMVQTWKMEQYP